MMADGGVRSPRLAGTPELIFRWRGSRQPLMPKLLALALAAVLFTLLMTIRVRVDVPDKSAPRRASVIFLRDDLQGRALTLRAKEGGPFPSKFEPSQWEGMAGLEAVALDAVRYQPPVYQPGLQPLPAENQLKPLELAAKGVSFFPQRVPLPDAVPDVAKLKLAPVLYPLSGTTRDILSVDLPSFGAVVDANLTSLSWRFLVRLNPDGSVTDCVSLEPGGGPGGTELEKWLRAITFKADPGKPSRWIAVGIGFTNQPVDGTDAR